MEIREFMQKVVQEINKRFGDNLSIKTDISEGLHEIIILNGEVEHSIYIDAFYEVYIKTDNLNKVMNDIVEAVRKN